MQYKRVEAHTFSRDRRYKHNIAQTLAASQGHYSPDRARPTGVARQVMDVDVDKSAHDNHCGEANKNGAEAVE